MNDPFSLLEEDKLRIYVSNTFNMLESCNLSKVSEDDILNSIYNSVEICYNQNNMNLLNSIIEFIDLKNIGLHKFTIITILSATYSYKDLLPKRKDFYNKIKNLHADDKEFLLIIKDLE